jgi:hypothetical protein
VTELQAVSFGIMEAIVSVVFWGIVFTATAVAVTRRFERRFLWWGWIILVAILTLAGTVAFHRSLPAGVGSVGMTAYALGMFIGIPTAVVAFIAARIHRRIPQRSWFAHFALTFLAYCASLPFALIIGAIPYS